MRKPKAVKTKPDGVVFVEIVAKTPAAEVFRSSEAVIIKKGRDFYVDNSQQNGSIGGAVTSSVERALKSIKTHSGTDVTEFTLTVTVK